MTKEEKLALVNSVRWWHHIDLGAGIITPGHQGDPGVNLRYLEWAHIPTDLTGNTVLDIGCSDGFYSFACEQRGAKVTAIDDPKLYGPESFMIAQQILGTNVKYVPVNLFDLKPVELGKFDIVLALGLLYHLKSFYIGLEIIKQLTKDDGLLVIQSHILDTDEPLAKFIPGPDHCMWYPSLSCLTLVLEDVGFVVQATYPLSGGVIIHATPRLSSNPTKRTSLNRCFHQ